MCLAGMDLSQRLKELFERYLRRDLPTAEVEELVSLLGQADAEDALTEPMRRLWEGMRSKSVEHKVDWDRMYRRVSQVEDGLAHAQGGGSRRGEVWRWRALAAAFLGLAGLAGYWSIAYRPRVADKGLSPAVSTGAVVKAGGVTKGVVSAWQTADNKKIIHLPDGSMVILNRHSSLRYAATGGSGVREVTLDGEAYFDIVHRPDDAFLVRTGKIVTRVLGTAFNIRAYSTETSIQVTVDHGKVQVLKGASNMVLLSDKEQMRYEPGSESYHEQRVSLKPVMAWKPVEISFDDITMEEAAKRIGERFKVGFKFVNPVLKECRITATFYMEDDLDQIMTVICGVNRSKFEIGGSLVTIDGKGCN
jgi:transmembrane sensor